VLVSVAGSVATVFSSLPLSHPAKAARQKTAIDAHALTAPEYGNAI
jgi:hypothetical protein